MRSEIMGVAEQVNGTKEVVNETHVLEGCPRWVWWFSAELCPLLGTGKAEAAPRMVLYVIKGLRGCGQDSRKDCWKLRCSQDDL